MPTKTPSPERRMPPRPVDLELPPPYDLFHVSVNMAFSPEKLAALGPSSTEADLAATLGRVILSHDIVDEDGADLPPASDPAFWRRCPADLVAAIFAEIKGNLGKLPKANGVP